MLLREPVWMPHATGVGIGAYYNFHGNNYTLDPENGNYQKLSMCNDELIELGVSYKYLV